MYLYKVKSEVSHTFKTKFHQILTF